MRFMSWLQLAIFNPCTPSSLRLWKEFVKLEWYPGTVAIAILLHNTTVFEGGVVGADRHPIIFCRARQNHKNINKRCSRSPKLNFAFHCRWANWHETRSGWCWHTNFGRSLCMWREVFAINLELTARHWAQRGLLLPLLAKSHPCGKLVALLIPCGLLLIAAKQRERPAAVSHRFIQWSCLLPIFQKYQDSAPIKTSRKVSAPFQTYLWFKRNHLCLTIF